MQVTAGAPGKWATELRDKAIDKDRIKHKVWIVPISFCAMLPINGTWYLPRGAAFETETLKEARVYNIQCMQGKSPSSPNNFTNLINLVFQGIHKTADGEKLLVHYSNMYECHG